MYSGNLTSGYVTELSREFHSTWRVITRCNVYSKLLELLHENGIVLLVNKIMKDYCERYADRVNRSAL